MKIYNKLPIMVYDKHMKGNKTCFDMIMFENTTCLHGLTLSAPVLFLIFFIMGAVSFISVQPYDMWK